LSGMTSVSAGLEVLFVLIVTALLAEITNAFTAETSSAIAICTLVTITMGVYPQLFARLGEATPF